MELYENLWRSRAEKHHAKKHQQNLRNPMKDPSYPMCYSMRNEVIVPKFMEFWQEYQEEVPEAEGYNRNTVQAVCELLSMDEEKILEEENTRVQQLVERIIESVRYEERPKIKVLMLRRRVRAIVA